MIQAIHTPLHQTSPDKISAVAIQASPYKVYANLEKVRESKEVHLEVIDGFLSKPESLAFSHAELLPGAIFCVNLSVIETEGFSTYYRSEPMELPALANSLMVKVLKKGKVAGIQHISLDGEILGSF
jgi:hypothetical protein